MVSPATHCLLFSCSHSEGEDIRNDTHKPVSWLSAFNGRSSGQNVLCPLKRQKKTGCHISAWFFSKQALLKKSENNQPWFIERQCSLIYYCHWYLSESGFSFGLSFWHTVGVHVLAFDVLCVFSISTFSPYACWQFSTSVNM